MRTTTPFMIALLSTSLGTLVACDADTKDNDTTADTDNNDTSPDTDDTDDTDDDTDDTVQQTSYSGLISDEGGTQDAHLAGSYMLDAATMVEVWSISDSGGMELMGSSSVEADGSFEIMVDETAQDDSDDYSVMHALSASGDVVASAVIEEMGMDDEDSFYSRLDVESTIEAWAWLDRVEEEGDADAANYTDIRTRIDAALATSVYSAYDDSDADGEEAMAALTAALSASLDAMIMSYNDSGYTGDSSDMYGLTAEASQSLSAALASSSTEEDYSAAYADFFSELEILLEGEGMDAEDRYDAEAAAALAFRLTLDAILAGESDVEEDGERASGRLEAAAMVDFVADLVSENGDEVDSEDTAFMLDAATELMAELENTNDGEATEEAWTRYAASVMVTVDAILNANRADTDDGLLDDIIDLDDSKEGSDKEDYVEEILEGDLSTTLDFLFNGELSAVSSSLEEDFDGSSTSEERASASLSFFSSMDAAVAYFIEDYEDGSTSSGALSMSSELMITATSSYVRSER